MNASLPGKRLTTVGSYSKTDRVMAAKKHDWKALEDEYVRGGVSLSLDGLADKHGINQGYFRRKAAELKWTKKKEQYRDEISAEAEKITKKTEAKRRARMLTIADSMKALGAEALRRTIQDFDSDTKKRLDLDDLRLLIKTATDIEGKVLGMPDAVLMTGEELANRILGLLSELDAESEE